jgi:hypothetical protein
VCYDLARRGFRAAKSPFEFAPYDVVVDCKGQILRVQVKGSSHPSVKSTRQGGGKVLSYCFQASSVRKEDFDLIAYVALDEEIIRYRQAANIPAGYTHWMSKATMLREADRELLEFMD